MWNTKRPTSTIAVWLFWIELNSNEQDDVGLSSIEIDSREKEHWRDDEQDAHRCFEGRKSRC